MKVIRIYFEDQGQDFLSWDVDYAGNVIESMPFQTSIWQKCHVENLDYILAKVDDHVRFSSSLFSPGEERIIDYKITGINVIERGEI